MHMQATCVAVAGRSLLIRGESGTGKSRLALELVALGALLVADDGVLLSRRGDDLIARPFASQKGLIEVHGLGILRVPCAEPPPVIAILELCSDKKPRMPARTRRTVLGVEIDIIHQHPFPSAGVIMVALKHWPPEPPFTDGMP